MKEKIELLYSVHHVMFQRKLLQAVHNSKVWQLSCNKDCELFFQAIWAENSEEYVCIPGHLGIRENLADSAAD